MRKESCRGFTAIELTMSVVIMAALAAIALPKTGSVSSAVAAVSARARSDALGTSFASIVASGVAANPSAPYPTVQSLAASTSQGPLPLALDGSGVCVAPGRKAATFADGAMAKPTAAASDVAKSLATEPADDSAHCPATLFGA